VFFDVLKGLRISAGEFIAMANKAFIKIVLLSLVLLLGVFSSLTAGESRLEFVETEVILFPDGFFLVLIHSSMHGFNISKPSLKKNHEWSEFS
jgi:hypothetical protein